MQVFGLQDLRLGNDEMVRLRNRDLKNLLRHKKLYLVLDLDHTLLTSTRLLDITPDEEYLNSQTDSLQGKMYYQFVYFSCGSLVWFHVGDTFPLLQIRLRMSSWEKLHKHIHKHPPFNVGGHENTNGIFWVYCTTK